MALLAVCVGVSAQSKLLLGGAGSSSVIIIDRETQNIEWQYDGVKKQCNSVTTAPDGSVAFSYFDGAKLVSKDKKTIFDFKAKEGEMVHSISAIRGGFLIGIAGTPTRVVEVDKMGNIKKEVTYDTGVTDLKKQFRQITKTINNTYVIPVAAQKRIVEINTQGRIIKEIELEHAAMYVTTNNDGDWLISCGHAGSVYKVDRDSGEVYTILHSADLGNGIKLGFAAGMTALENGNYLLTNWVGHKGDETQPVLLEITDAGEVVSTMKKLDGYTFVSAVCAAK